MFTQYLIVLVFGVSAVVVNVGCSNTIRELDSEGNVVAEISHSDGKIDGVWTTYHPNGEVAFEREFEDGKAVGTSTIFDEDGDERFEVSFDDGDMNGIWTDRHGAVRNEVEYKDGVIVRVTTYEHGKRLSEEQREAGKSTRTVFDESGSPQEQRVFAKGMLSAWKIWDGGGTLRMEIEFDNGSWEGAWTTYDANGKPLRIMHVRDTTPVSHQRRWRR